MARTAQHAHGRRRDVLLHAAMLGVGVSLLCWCGVALTRETGNVAALWIANALPVAVMLGEKTATWPRWLLATIAGNLGFNLLWGDGIYLSLGFAFANVLEVALAAYLTRLALGHDRRPDGWQGQIKFIICAGLVAPTVGAATGALLVHSAFNANLWDVFPVWWAGDAAGMILFGIFFMQFRSSSAHILAKRFALLEWLALGATFALLSHITFVLYQPLPLLYLYAPAILWGAVRFGLFGAATVAGTVLIVATVLTENGFGPVAIALAESSSAARISFVQLSVAILFLPPMAAALFLDALQAARVQLLEAKVQAEAADRAKSTFLAQMSHELRTPLNAIQGFTEVMHHEMFGALGSPRYKDYCQDVLTSTRHLTSIVNNLLDLAKVEAGKWRLSLSRFALDAVIADSMLMIRDRAERGGVAVTVAMPAGGCMVVADERAMRQVIINILTNAIKFTPEGGSVTISVSQTSQGETSIRIVDTGQGMSADELRDALVPYGGTSINKPRRHSDTGLGLPLSKMLVELHGGRFTVESEPDVGTTVTIMIPSPESRGAEPATTPQAA